MKHIRWIALALALCLALVLVSCGLMPFQEEIRGSGVLKKAELPLSAAAAGYALRIEGISVRNASALTVVIDESLKGAAVLETDNNILHRLTFEHGPAADRITLGAPRGVVFLPTKITLTVGAPVREIVIDGLWALSYDCPSVKSFKLRADGSINGDFIFGALDNLDMGFGGLSDVNMRSEGVRACKLTVDGTLNGNFDFGEMDSLDMTFGGFSTVNLRSRSVKACELRADGTVTGDFDFGEMDALHMNLSGLHTLRMRGTAQRVTASLDGSASISAFDLVAQEVRLDCQGLNNCEVTAEQSLDVTLEGGGSVTYAGRPVINQRIEGLGRVKAR